MAEFLSSLNQQQKKAVKTIDGPIRIIAGPGSGKTKTIISRIAYLIDSGIAPKSILAITFTNKSAQEMQQRVEKQIKLKEQKPFISTYHSFCAKLIRKYVDKIPLGKFNRNYSIMDATDQKLLVNKIYKELKVSSTLIDIDSALSYVSYCKINGISVDEAYDNAKDEIENTKAEIYDDYLLHQSKNNSLDFDDLIVYAVVILENNDDIRKLVSEKYQFIHVDEFQDTNAIQYRLIKLLASVHNNILVVGDPDQNIYSWRGSDIKIIFNFEKDFPNTKTIYLNKNYRSTKTILGLSSEFIQSNKVRFDRELKTDNLKGDSVLVYPGFTEEDEAQWICNKISRLKDEGVNLDEIMVLFRSQFISRSIESELLSYDIPFKIIGGVRFFERKEIKTSLAYLRFSSQKDDVSFLQIISSPKRGIGEQKLMHIKSLAKKHKKTYWEIISNHQEECNFNEKQLKSINEFIKAFNSSPSDADKNFFTGFQELLAEAGFLRVLSQDSKNLVRYDNVKELIRAIKTLCRKNNELTVGKYLSDVALEWISDDETSKNTVKLMTIHKSKGLEAGHVFIMGLSDSVLPSSRATNDSELEEERRLFYVAATRAKTNLYLTYSKQKKPSVFFQCFDSKYLKEGDWGVKQMAVEAKVEHSTFGEGTVVHMDGDIVQIDFGKEYGIKTMMSNHKSIKVQG